MIDNIREKFKKLEDIDNDSLYLIESYDDISGYFIHNQKIVFIMKNIEESKEDSIDTEYLKMKTDVHIESTINLPTFKADRYNLLYYNGDIMNDEFSLFINLCEMYQSNKDKVTFRDFFMAIYSLFKDVTQSKLFDSIGLFGELSIIDIIYRNYDIDLASNWHQGGAYSKYDIVTKHKNYDVKTTIKDGNSFRIKHKQLFNDDDNYVILVKLEINEQGITLDELIKNIRIKEPFSNNFTFQVNLEKDRLKIGKGLDLKYKFKMYQIYDIKDLTVIDSIPDNISSLSYDYNFSGEKEYNKDKFISDIRIK